MANNFNTDEILKEFFSIPDNEYVMSAEELEHLTSVFTLPNVTNDVQQHHESSTDNGKHICPECGLTFSNKSNMTRHRKAQHLNQTFSCHKCNSVFSYVYALKRHEKVCKKNRSDNGDDTSNHGPSGINAKKGGNAKSSYGGSPNPGPSGINAKKGGNAKSSHGGSPNPGPSGINAKKGGNAKSSHGVSPNPGSRKAVAKGSQKRQNAENNSMSCTRCGKTFRFPYKLRQHHKSCLDITTKKSKSKPLKKTGFNCRKCRERFLTRHQLYIHYMTSHTPQRGGALQSPPWQNDLPPWDGNEELQRVYQANQSLILRQHERGPVRSVYNFPIGNDFTIEQVMERAERIYQEQQSSFRLNLQFGVILIHAETGDCWFFKPFENHQLIQRPLYVSKRRDLLRLRRRLEKLDITQYVLVQRPDTKWKPLLVTNVQMTVTKLNFPLGRASIQLPEFIKKKRCIVSLDLDRNGKEYNDDLCSFRCLVVHRGHHTGKLETNTKTLFNQWLQYCRDNRLPSNRDLFCGISLEELPHFERCFDTNVNAFELKVEEEEEMAIPVYKSLEKHDDTMNVNVFNCHLSYITNLETYCQKYQCSGCMKLFKLVNNMLRHQKNCKGVTAYEFPGDFYKRPLTIFDKLLEYGVHTEPEERIYPWFCVWDMEAILSPIPSEETDKLKWTQEHLPISVSLCSNVDGFELPHCIIEPDLQVLVREMIEYMERVRQRAYVLALEKFEHVFQEIDNLLFKTACEGMNDEDSDLEVDVENSDLEEDFDQNKAKKYLVLGPASDDDETTGNLMAKVEELREGLDDYCQQLICLGFNSQRYDMNLIKRRLGKQLSMDGCKKPFTVKRQNNYSCLSNEFFKFLDITQYLAPGLNYAAFLKAFDVSEAKGYFPYEWFDNLQKLDATALPPVEDWYSTLKGCNVLKDGDLSAEENHARLLQVWKDQEMKTFRDYLEYYNNLDVGPFVQAVINLQKYYFKRNIDIFKISISVPGLARYMLFESGRKAGACFALVDAANADLYHTIKKNIIGGPSIVFHRHHEKDKTFIRGNPNKVCQTVCGFDANALYLYCLGKNMPTGPFIRRRIENGFKPEKRDRFMVGIYWMDYLNKTQDLNIRHKVNEGREKRVGKYPVDGFDERTNTVYQFHGCYYHGHQCWMTKKITNEKWLQTRAEKLDKTESISRFIKNQGYELVEMWECHFHNECRKHPDLKSYVVERRLETPPGSMSEEDILHGVRTGKMFGMVEVDIRVPEVWPNHFHHPTMSPREYFSEMSPIFCTTDVPFDCIGDHMQEHAEKFGLSKKPRRLLVGGMKAKKILLATPLLKWYLEHGMEVTQIYQSIEYKPMSCFYKFVDDVSDARRSGDVDPSKSIIADTRKLEGNSAYGSTIMDQEKFQDVVYVQGLGNVMREANKPQFKKLCTLLEDEEYYEVEKAKEELRIDMPVQIGYFILQYAKLHMLQFYYDFMSEFVDRHDFEYCEMDTDSAYMALSGPSLESVIRPEKMEEYRRGMEARCDNFPFRADGINWFPRTCCSKHRSYDRRTPGLFKLEYQGDNIISLCSKTYIVSRCRSNAPSLCRKTAQGLLRKAKNLRKKEYRHPYSVRRESKFSSKGLTKRLIKAPLSIFKNVLKTQRPGVGLNRGFRARNNTIFSYNQQRNGFTYFYCKRKVADDGVSTSPLDLELCPLDKKKEEDPLELEQDNEIADQLLVDTLNELMES